MQTRLASDVAQLPRNRGYFAEKHFDEREKSSRQASKNTLSLAEINLPIAISKARGLNPCPWRERDRRNFVSLVGDCSSTATA